MTKENTHRTVSLADLTWREYAACSGKQELFFSDHKLTVVREAKQVCAGCSVKQQCLSHAMKHDEYGVWGGMTANERRKARRAQKVNLRIAK